MVADGKKAQRLYAVSGGSEIEGCRFHFGGQYAVGGQLIKVDLVVIEAILRQDIAHMKGYVQFAGGGYALFQKMEIRCGREIDAMTKGVMGHVGVRGAGLGKNQIAHGNLFLQCPAGADAEDPFDAVLGDQFVGVDGHGRHPHAGALDGNGNALIRTSVAQHVADVGIFFGPV